MVNNVEEKCAELINLESTYFGTDKTNKIKQIVKELKTKIKTTEKSIKKSEIYYIQGVINSIGDEYKKESEQFLTKSLKIDPQNIQAWNLLGETYMKKKDYTQAESCFYYALKMKKNSESFCKLASINRLRGNESISFSKEAIALDFSNPKSWYSHGNSYFTKYMNESLDRMDLINSYKCYIKSKNLGLRTPELFFNLSIACKYLERFEEAFIGFKTAYEIDETFTMAKMELELLGNCIEKMIQFSNCTVKEKNENFKDFSIPEFFNLAKDETFDGEIKLNVMEKIKFSDLIILGTMDCENNIVFCSLYYISPKAINPSI
eukprot:gene6657-10822_t